MSENPNLLNLQTSECIQVREKMVFGRLESSDVQIMDKNASRRHAELEKRGVEYFIKDLGSSNGTMVNGSKLEEEKKLKHGDKIEFGTLQFEFRMPSSTFGKRTAALVKLKEKIWLNFELLGIGVIESKMGKDECSILIEAWRKSCVDFVESHQGTVMKSEEGFVVAVWDDASIMNRFRALAAARTTLLGTKIFLRSYEKLFVEGASEIGMIALLNLSDYLQEGLQMLKQAQKKSPAIWVRESFLADWADLPESEPITVEGVTGLRKLSEI